VPLADPVECRPKPLLRERAGDPRGDRGVERHRLRREEDSHLGLGAPKLHQTAEMKA